MNQELENIIWKRRIIKGIIIFLIVGLVLFILDEFLTLSSTTEYMVDYLVIAWLSALGTLFAISSWAKRLWYQPKSLKKFFYFTLISTIIITILLTLVTFNIYQSNPLGI